MRRLIWAICDLSDCLSDCGLVDEFELVGMDTAAAAGFIILRGSCGALAKCPLGRVHLLTSCSTGAVAIYEVEVVVPPAVLLPFIIAAFERDEGLCL